MINDNCYLWRRFISVMSAFKEERLNHLNAVCFRLAQKPQIEGKAASKEFCKLPPMAFPFYVTSSNWTWTSKAKKIKWQNSMFSTTAGRKWTVFRQAKSWWPTTNCARTTRVNEIVNCKVSMFLNTTEGKNKSEPLGYRAIWYEIITLFKCFVSDNYFPP